LPEASHITSADLKNNQQLSGAIDIKNLSFSYEPNSIKVLENISCCIPANSFVGIVGPSGSGKSTLLRLLLRFEQPNLGKIYFDHQDLDELDIELVRNQIGAVLPNDRLLHGNIFSNITAYSPVLTIDDAWAAAHIVGLAEDIAAMSMGMFTFIGENGAGLAGGQRQRLLIARAIVRQPRIILFDEATSALDNISQNLVIQSIKQLNTTRVVVAHRLSTVRDADQIIVLNAGKIVETGTYQQLISSGGLFAKMAERQMV
jgi:ATP-binding cassette subfamily C protein